MTLVKAIKFETFYTDENGNLVIDEFLVENNEYNYFKILESRYTRGIQFVKMFDFQFAKEEKIPFEMIDPRIWLMIGEFAIETIPMLEEHANNESADPVVESTEEGPSVAETVVAERGKYTITFNNVTYYFTNKRKAVRRFNEIKKECPGEDISLHIPK